MLVAISWGASTLQAAPARTAPPGRGSVSSQLARLTRRVAEHESQLRLDEPGVPGRAGRGAPMVPVTQQVIDEDRVFRSGALRQLRELAPGFATLAPRDRVDAELLRGRLERWAIDRDEMRRFETDPGFFLARVDGGLRELLVGRPGVLCHRLGLATRRLRAVPEIMRAAKIGLAHPSPLAVEFAISRLDQTLALYRNELPATLLECRESGAMAGFAMADTLAVRALQQHAEWLRNVAFEHADGAWPMGRERFERWLRATTGDTTAIDGLRARASHELAEAGPVEDSPEAVFRADSVRAAVTDRLLEARANRHGRRTPRGLRTVLGRRELALPWAPYTQSLRAQPATPAAEPAVFAPSRLDLAGLLVEFDLHAGAATLDDGRRRFQREAGLDSAAAEFAARSSAITPWRAVTVISAWQLESLRLEAATRLSARFSAEALLREVIDAGAVPLPAVGEEILQRLGARPAAATIVR